MQDPKPIPSSVGDFISSIEAELGNPVDLYFEPFGNSSFTVVFLSSFTDQTDLQGYLLQSLLQVSQETNPSWDQLLGSTPKGIHFCRDNMGDAIGDLLKGYTLVHLSGSKIVYSFDTHKEVKRQPSEPLVERTIRGPKVSLLEVLDENFLMIRRTIKNNHLRIDGMHIGDRTQTRVAILYLDDVAEPAIVAEVKRRLTEIHIDAVIDSGYIEQLITDSRYSIFPLTQSTERPDKVEAGILEGRIAILVDGSSNGILVPVTVNELYQSPEDYYFTFWFGAFLRFFRILGNNIAVALPGLYIALVGVNPELLPIKFALTISGSRMGVAFPILIELLIMETVIEIFREGSLRLPTTVSQTLGVTAGIVLGAASVSAGLISNATLVVVIITSIASYSGPSYEIGLSWRILRYVLILAAAFMGIYGLVVAGIMILTHAANQNSFGISYLAPWAPIEILELEDTVIRRPIWLRRRLRIYHPIDRSRMGAGAQSGKKGNKP
ncbi:MAG TPA: spore germination protein [Bacillota bacterium]|nr:spore germination protein [Bacillota bacterium]